MNYINVFELYQSIFEGGMPDIPKFLSAVDRKKVLQNLKKSNEGIHFTNNFEVTNAPVEEENWAKMTRAEKDKILSNYEKLKAFPDHSGNLPKSILDFFLEYQAKYPNVPGIYNYLSIAYLKSGKLDKYNECLFETIKKFPNYLFGKTVLCEHYLNTAQLKKIPEVLDHKFEINQHFPPDKKLYHVSEIIGFYYTVGRYFARIGKIEPAYRAYFLLSDLDTNPKATQLLGAEIFLYEYELATKNMKNRK